MLNVVQKEEALEVLLNDAAKIYNLINSQKNHLCLTECPAFDEVVDTQMYGLSREIDFARKIGVITEEEGQRILSDLEKNLNDVYTNEFEKKKNQST